MRKKLIALFLFLITLTPAFAAGDRFEIELGWGASYYEVLSDDEYIGYDYGGINMNENFPIGDKYTTNAIFARAYTSLSRKVNIGVGVAYERYWQQYKTGKTDKRYISVLPLIKLNWMNKEKFKLYSTAGIGAAFVEDKGLKPIYENSSYWQLTGNLTFIGFSYGKRMYCFSEFGIGAFGILNIGLGYRIFNNKK